MMSPSVKLSRVLLSPAAWEKMAWTRARPFFSRPAAIELDRGRVLVSPRDGLQVNGVIFTSQWIYPLRARLLYKQQGVGINILNRLFILFTAIVICKRTRQTGHYVDAPKHLTSLTHSSLVFSRLGSADRQGVGVHVADLSLGLALGLRLTLRGWRSSLRDTGFRPVLVSMDPRRPVHQRHAIRTH